jgi:hypothetical protein
VFRNCDVAQAIRTDLAAIGVTVDFDQNTANFGDDYGSASFPAYVAHFYDRASSPISQWSRFLQDQHGWRDVQLYRLYYKALRADPAHLKTIERQMITRSITQADWLPVVATTSLLAYNPKRVSGIARPSEFSFQVVDWSPPS